MACLFDVCFVGLKCYDLLVGNDPPRYLGGIEKQLVSLAQGLAQQGLRVAFITYDHGQETVSEKNGLTLFKSFSPDTGIPVLRFVHPRMTKLWSAMRQANAAVYLQMGAGSETGVVALGCYWQKRRFVYLVASDADCEQGYPLLRTKREQILYKSGLKAADQIVAQTVKQQHLLNDNFGLKAKVLPFRLPL